MCDKNYETWLHTAKRNTDVCNRFFLEQPSNHHSTIQVGLDFDVYMLILPQVYDYCRRLADHEINGEHSEYQEVLAAFKQHQHDHIPRESDRLVPQNLESRVKALSQIQGHLYEYPIDFLADDLKLGKLKPATISAEGVLPAKTFT